MSKIELVWNEVGENKVASSPEECCIYIFLLRNIPFYVGTAKKSLRSRIAQHQELFEKGGRTFILPDFIDENWPRRFRTMDENASWLYVPGSTDTFKQDQSLSFWKSLRILYAPIHEPAQLKIIESKIQRDLTNYFINEYYLSEQQLRIPRSRSSRLFGKIETAKNERLNALQIKHHWSNVTNPPKDYFI